MLVTKICCNHYGYFYETLTNFKSYTNDNIIVDNHNENQTLDISCIIREGFLEKESKYFKIIRKRFCVLVNNKLYTYKNENEYI